MEHFDRETRSALEAKEFAQWIAFAPMVFQASRILRDSGILSVIKAAGKKGLDFDSICSAGKLSHYATRVLLEAGLGIQLLLLKEDRYFISTTGLFVLDDKMTRVNMDFTQDICYEGMLCLDESLEKGYPAGLKVLGEWGTIYEGLSKLPEKRKKSWFDFDHYYSDSAFDSAVKHVLAEKPVTLLDIGGNTGKFTTTCLLADPDIKMTILDLPGQAAMAKKSLEEKKLISRVNFLEMNILEPDKTISGKFSAIWMSQFLDCFSDEQIIMILNKCREALEKNGYIYILETFWDRQRFRASAFCLQMTSLYFTAMANGNSQMYDSKVFFKLVEKSGLEIVEVTDNIGVSHSLLKCKVR